MKQTLYYVHDPMCSWCYAFKSVLKKLRDNLPTTIHFQTVIGGLAPDSKEVMPEDIQKRYNMLGAVLKKNVPKFNLILIFGTKQRQFVPLIRHVVHY